MQEAPFSPIKDPDDACVTFNVLLVFKQYGVSKDVRPIILSYMPQYIPNRSIFARVFNYCGSSPELVKSCPLSWFKHVYDNAEKKNNESLLSVLTADIAEYRLSQVGRLLTTHTVAEYRKNLFAHAKILKLLDLDQIEQHRQPIEEAVQYYLETRPYRI